MVNHALRLRKGTSTEAYPKNLLPKLVVNQSLRVSGKATLGRIRPSECPTLSHSSYISHWLSTSSGRPVDLTQVDPGSVIALNFTTTLRGRAMAHAMA